VSADLVRDLNRLGDEAAWPETPDLAERVVARLDPPRPKRRGRRLVVAVALALLVPAAAAVAFPGARDDVLEWIGLKSVEVERRPDQPTAPRAAPNELGVVVTPEQAAPRAGFEPVLPPALGKPGEIRERAGVVTILYARGLRLQERRGALDDVLLRKTVGPANEIRPVPEGLFLAGRHVYLFLGPDGEVVEDRTRSAGNALISQRGDILLRLEGDETLTYERARALLGPR
jgi:hypothetical protein